MKQKTKKPERPMTASEVADLLGISSGTVRMFCREGKFKFVKLDGETGPYLIDRKSVREFMRKNPDVGK